LIVSALAAAVSVFAFVWLYRDSLLRGIDTRNAQFLAAFLMVLAVAGAVALALPEEQTEKYLEPDEVKLLVLAGLAAAVGSIVLAAVYWASNRAEPGRVAICPQCGSEIPYGVSVCPSCGHSLAQERSTKEAPDEGDKFDEDAIEDIGHLGEPPAQYPGAAPDPVAQAGTLISGSEGGRVAEHLAWLAVLQGPGTQRGKIHLLGDETRIGRGVKTACHVVVADPLVSDDHALIRWRDGAFLLADMVSSTTTYVNGSRIDRCLVNDRDEIRVGETEFVFIQAVPDQREPHTSSTDAEEGE